LSLRLCVSFVSPAATRYIIWHVSQKVNRFFKVFLLFATVFLPVSHKKSVQIVSFVLVF